MRKLIPIAVLIAGCSQQPPPHMDVLCGGFSQAAYEAYRAETLAANHHEQEVECCGKCGKNGLPKGKVLSGDRQKIVPCPCPETCQCKCATGECRK